MFCLCKMAQKTKQNKKDPKNSSSWNITGIHSEIRKPSIKKEKEKKKNHSCKGNIV